MRDKDINEKRQRRQTLRQARAAISAVEHGRLSCFVQQRVLQMQCLRMTDTVGLYVGVGSEVRTDHLLKMLINDGHQVALPSLDGESMVMRRVRAAKELAVGAYGVPEPPVSAEAMTPDILIVPGVAFTERGHRLGQGAGHYDRYLAGRAVMPVTIGLAFDEQIVDELPVEPHDQRLHFVATPTRLIDCQD